MRSEMKNVREPRSPRFGWAKVVVLALLPVVGGCQHDRAGPQVAGWQLLDPEQRHPILVSKEPANLNLRVATGSTGLTSSQRGRVMDFLSRNRAGDAGNSRFLIAAPGGTANESAAMEAAEDVRYLMLANGYSDASISVEAYHANTREAPLRISYMRYVADAPDCGLDWSENLARAYQNTAYPNFGCAGQRNLAVMVANPADLVGPRTMSPRDSNRRDDMYNKYVKGEMLGAKEEATKVKISD